MKDTCLLCFVFSIYKSLREPNGRDNADISHWSGYFNWGSKSQRRKAEKIIGFRVVLIQLKEASYWCHKKNTHRRTKVVVSC